MKKNPGFLRRAAVIFCVGAISLSLCSCGILSLNHKTDGENDADPTDTTYSFEEFDVVENDYNSEINSFSRDISNNDYGGGAAKIVSAKSSLIIPDDNTSAVISKELADRNQAVADRLNLSITSVQTDADTMLDQILAANRSGSYYADLVMIPQSYIGAYAVQGALMNLRGLPDFETDGGYLSASGVAAGTGGNSVYAVAGAASLDPYSLSAVFFNTDIISSLGLESPYSLVDNGEWTFDKYLEYTTALASLDGTYYSYAAQNTSTYLADLLYFSGGGTLTASSLGYYPSMAITSDGAGGIIEKISSIINDPKSAGNAVTGIDTFNSGNVLFLFERLSSLPTLSTSPVNWGVLPLPKYDSGQQEYYSLAYYEDAMFFGTVPTVANVDMASDLLTALNVMSYGYTADAYVKNASYYNLRDNDSIRMLEYIVQSPVYDLAYSFAGVSDALPSATFMAVRNTVAGVSSLERYLDMWSDNFQNAMYGLFEAG